MIENQRPKDALKRPPGWAGLRNCVWRCDTELGKANKNRDYRHQDVLSLNAEIEELEAHKAKLLIDKDVKEFMGSDGLQRSDRRFEDYELIKTLKARLEVRVELR